MTKKVYGIPAPKTLTELLGIIESFTEQHVNAEWSLAHIVLSDYNLDDHSIDYCLDTCFTKEWLSQVNQKPDDEEINATREFLIWLKTIPESVRMCD